MHDGSSVGAFVGILLAIVLFGLYAWSIVWAYGDAEKRGKSGCLVALLVIFLSWPIGLIAWLVFRPDDRRRP
jgi:hypothetical protein